MLRKNGTPEDLQKQWIGHSSLRTTDRYSHTHQELEYRRLAGKQSWTQFRCWTQWTQNEGWDFGWKCLKRMVRPERFELPTFWFVARRSIQLS